MVSCLLFHVYIGVLILSPYCGIYVPVLSFSRWFDGRGVSLLPGVGRPRYDKRVFVRLHVFWPDRAFSRLKCQEWISGCRKIKREQRRVCR